MCHSLLAYRVSIEKSADNLMGVPLYDICHFSLDTFRILPLSFNFCKFDYYVYWGVSPWVYPTWDSLCFLDLVDYLFHMLGKFSAITSSNIFSGPFSFSSPSGTAKMWILVHLMLSQRSLWLSSFLFILSSIFCSAAVISSSLSSCYSAIDSF